MKKIFVKHYFKIGPKKKEHIFASMEEVFVTGYYDEEKNTIKIEEVVDRYKDGKRIEDIIFSHTFTLEGLDDYIHHNGFYENDHKEIYMYALDYLERNKDKC